VAAKALPSLQRDESSLHDLKNPVDWSKQKAQAIGHLR
jgi:hypothetical protein